MSTAEVEFSSVEVAADLAWRLRSEVHKAVIGQEQAVAQVLIALLAGGHVLLEGVPGIGKTLIARATARAFRGATSRIQFTPDLMPSDVVGHVFYDLRSGQFEVRRGPVFTNVLLADEINRAPAKTQAALLEVMQEQQVTLEGESLGVPRPFLTLATQNPFEQEGTYPLPEAQLDRFLLKVLIGYPPEEEEREMVRRVSAGAVGEGLDVEAVQPVLDAAQVVGLQRVAARLHVDPAVADYAVRIARQTRSWPGVTLGAGPRGGLALLRAARAAALLEGRDHVLPDDVRAIALPALRHRVHLSPDLEIEGQRADDVLRALLESVPAPRA
jgi:MoxR-like ATPase